MGIYSYTERHRTPTTKEIDMRISKQNWNSIKEATLAGITITEEIECGNGYMFIIRGIDKDGTQVEVTENVFPERCEGGTCFVAWIDAEFDTEETRYEVFESNEDFWANAED